MTTILTIDDFYPTPLALAIVARGLNYGPQEYKGHTYNGIGLGFEPEKIWLYIQAALGRQVTPVLNYFRLGTKTEPTTTYIHADGVCANYAAVLYLTEAPVDVIAGTAFWKHRETGLLAAPTEQWIRANVGDSEEAVKAFIVKLNSDGNDETKWQMTDLVGQRFNRLTIYPSNFFHSRYPKDAWGSAVNDGRIVWTGFMNIQ